MKRHMARGAYRAKPSLRSFSSESLQSGKSSAAMRVRNTKNANLINPSPTDVSVSSQNSRLSRGRRAGPHHGGNTRSALVSPSRSPSPSPSMGCGSVNTNLNMGRMTIMSEQNGESHDIRMELSFDGGNEVELVDDGKNSFENSLLDGAAAEVERQQIKKEFMGNSILEDSDECNETDMTMESTDISSFMISSRNYGLNESCTSEASIPSMARTDILTSRASTAVLSLLNKNKDPSAAPYGGASFRNSTSRRNSCRATLPPTEPAPPNHLPNPSDLAIQLSTRLLDPSQQLSNLLAVIRAPTHIASWTRKKNACGALKILSTKKHHRVQLAWTRDVLPSIASVISIHSQCFSHKHADELSNFIEARRRTVAALLNLCAIPDNRVLILHTQGMTGAMVNTIRDDRFESRQGICACLAFLAKTKENRPHIAQDLDLVSALTGVVSVTADMDVIAEENGVVGVTENSDSDTSDDDTYSVEEIDMDLTMSVSVDMTSGGYDSGDESIEIDIREMRGDLADYGDKYTNKFLPKKKKKKKRKKKTQVREDSKQQDRGPQVDPYDDTHNHFLNGARVNTFATLLHLVNHKTNSYHLARNVTLISALIEVANKFNSPSHTRCVMILSHLSRLSANAQRLAFRVKNLIPTLVKNCCSRDPECRKYACFALQNLSYDKTCRQELAITPELLTNLCLCCISTEHYQEQLSSISTLRNLSDEPANLIQITNTHDCMATLMLVAHANDDSFDDTMQYLACDTLAYLSHWLMKIGMSGIMMGNGAEKGALFGQIPPLLPSQQIVVYQQWR